MFIQLVLQPASVIQILLVVSVRASFVSSTASFTPSLIESSRPAFEEFTKHMTSRAEIINTGVSGLILNVAVADGKLVI